VLAVLILLLTSCSSKREETSSSSELDKTYDYIELEQTTVSFPSFDVNVKLALPPNYTVTDERDGNLPFGNVASLLSPQRPVYFSIEYYDTIVGAITLVGNFPEGIKEDLRDGYIHVLFQGIRNGMGNTWEFPQQTPGVAQRDPETIYSDGQVGACYFIVYHAIQGKFGMYKKNYGVVCYDLDKMMYVAIEFDSDLEILKDTICEIARSVKIESNS
jgi:hypothetical protein